MNSLSTTSTLSSERFALWLLGARVIVIGTDACMDWGFWSTCFGSCVSIAVGVFVGVRAGVCVGGGGQFSDL